MLKDLSLSSRMRVCEAFAFVYTQRHLYGSLGARWACVQKANPKMVNQGFLCTFLFGA